MTVANALWSATLLLPAAATSDGACVEKYFDLNQGKQPLAAAAVANGLALADLTGGAGGTGAYVVDLDWSTELN